MTPEDIEMSARWDRVDAGRARLIAMRLLPFEYVKPEGKKKHRVVRFQRMFWLLDWLAYRWYVEDRRDFSDDELAYGTQQSAETVRRAAADCVGRGLLKVDWVSNVDPGYGIVGMGKRRYEIQWAEVDRANPDFERDPIGLEWLP